MLCFLTSRNIFGAPLIVHTSSVLVRWPQMTEIDFQPGRHILQGFFLLACIWFQCIHHWTNGSSLQLCTSARNMCGYVRVCVCNVIKTQNTVYFWIILWRRTLSMWCAVGPKFRGCCAPHLNGIIVCSTGRAGERADAPKTELTGWWIVRFLKFPPMAVWWFWGGNAGCSHTKDIRGQWGTRTGRRLTMGHV